MTTPQELLQLIAQLQKPSARRPLNSKQLSQVLFNTEAGPKLLHVESILHQLEQQGDIELELERNSKGFAFTVSRITPQGKKKL